jgi:hypothetical protein
MQGSTHSEIILALVKDLLPVVTAVGGAVWVVLQFIVHQREVRHQRFEQNERDARARMIEAQKPFLDYQQQRYFEVATVTGTLVTEEVGSQAWNAAEKRFWVLYWSELAIVEHRVVETAMVAVGTVLQQLKLEPNNEEHLRSFKAKSLDLAHSIRAAIASTWGTTGVVEQSLVAPIALK